MTIGAHIRRLGLNITGAALLVATPAAQAEAQSAATPPMGWNPYNVFDLNYGEAEVMAQADLLVSLGLARLGYVHVNVDDGWWLRREDDTIRVRTTIYPSAALPDGSTSLRPFVDRLHAMGLKAGIYTDIGLNTCSQRWRPRTPNLPEGTVRQREVGTYGHHAQDAALLFARWGFDFIKVDACGAADYGADVKEVRDGTFRAFTPLIVRERPQRSDAAELARQYASFADAARRGASGRSPLISICAWGQADVNDWARRYGQMSRTSFDIAPTWDAMLFNFDSAASRALFAGPGHWNDPDMLEVGNGAFDGAHLTAARAHMSLWAVLAAPLILGNDLRRMTPEIAAIISNREVIAIDQDPAGHQGVVVSRDGDGQVVAKALATTGHKAVALINRGTNPLTLSVELADLGLSATAPTTARDVWSGETRAVRNGRISVSLKPQETALLRVEGRPAEDNVDRPADLPARFDVADAGYKAPDRTPARQWVLAQIGFRPDGQPLMLDGVQDHAGLGVTAGSRIRIDLAGRYDRVSVDPRMPGKANGTYLIRVDGRMLAEGVASPQAHPIVLHVRDARQLELIAPPPSGGNTQFAWHNLRLTRRVTTRS
ncbi:NPCBM/NEW2 domain-containing protein [Sphingomonas sp. NPDC079357]|uniref:NPCBM/NEW2 domain-containing protein n=1 Tax=Sphingomonas sp. NPDC079357 TaxID=3364518 RepID=UPI00384DE59F